MLLLFDFAVGSQIQSSESIPILFSVERVHSHHSLSCLRWRSTFSLQQRPHQVKDPLHSYHFNHHATQNKYELYRDHFQARRRAAVASTAPMVSSSSLCLWLVSTAKRKVAAGHIFLDALVSRSIPRRCEAIWICLNNVGIPFIQIPLHASLTHCNLFICILSNNTKLSFEFNHLGTHQIQRAPRHRRLLLYVLVPLLRILQGQQ